MMTITLDNGTTKECRLAVCYEPQDDGDMKAVLHVDGEMAPVDLYLMMILLDRMQGDHPEVLDAVIDVWRERREKVWAELAKAEAMGGNDDDN